MNLGEWMNNGFEMLELTYYTDLLHRTITQTYYTP